MEAVKDPTVYPGSGDDAVCVAGKLGRERLEARVQRLPNTVDPNDPVKTPDPNGYGRRFVLTSIKWLNDG